MASARGSAGVKKTTPKAKETVQAPPANTSRKRKTNDDDNKPAPAAKKARSTQQAPPPKAKKAAVKPKVTKPKVAKADEAKPKEKKPQATKAQAVKHTAARPKVTTPKVTTPKIIVNKVPTQRLDVYVFGEGSSSELGLGTAKTAVDVKRPRLNPLLSSKDAGVVYLACGGMHVAALTHDNKILTWGVNDQGALGRDTTWDGGLKDMDDDDSDQSDSGLNPLESNPTAVPASNFPEDTTFVQLSAGDSHTLALTDDGLVYGWGCFRVRAFHFNDHSF